MLWRAFEPRTVRVHSDPVKDGQAIQPPIAPPNHRHPGLIAAVGLGLAAGRFAESIRKLRSYYWLREDHGSDGPGAHIPHPQRALDLMCACNTS
jgi:hypothetical protein